MIEGGEAERRRVFTEVDVAGPAELASSDGNQRSRTEPRISASESRP